MARISSDKRVGFVPIGRLRDITIRKTRSGFVVSEYNKPSEKENKRSASSSQLNRREVLRILQKMANNLKEAHKIGFKREVVYASHTRFLHHNYAIVDITDDGVLEIDYEQLQLSVGTLRTLKSLEVVKSGNIAEIKWQVEGLTNRDAYQNVLATAYCPDYKDENAVTEIYNKDRELVRRKDGEIKMTIPKEWGHMKVYIYVFTYQNENGSTKANASLTQFIKL